MEVAERETGQKWLFQGVCGFWARRTDKGTDDCATCVGRACVPGLDPRRDQDAALDRSPAFGKGNESQAGAEPGSPEHHLRSSTFSIVTVPTAMESYGAAWFTTTT